MSTNEQALELIELTYRLTRMLTEEVKRQVEPIRDLEIGEVLLLRAISAGQASPTDLSRQLHTHPTVMSRSLTQLVRSGLVQRSSDPEDSRRLQVTLTEYGAEITAAVAAVIRPAVQERLDLLPTDDARTLLRCLERLVAGE